MNKLERTKTVFPAIDVMKLVMAVLVVIMHKPLFLGDFRNYLLGSVIGDAAVPFFFAVSSFLFFRKLDRTDSSAVSVWIGYEKRLVQFYVLYTVLYLPCIFVKAYTGHYAEITIGGIVGELFTLAGRFFLNTSFVHFWYLNTLILCIAILFGLTRLTKNKWVVLGTGAAVYAAVSLASALPQFAGVMQVLPPVLFNVMKKGLICTCIGFFAAQTDDDVPKWEKALCPVLWAALLLCGILTYDSASPVWENVRLLGAFVCAWSTLRVCIGSELQPSPVYPILRRYSTLIYFLHLLFMWEGWAFLCRRVGIRNPEVHPFLYFCVTLFLAVLESTIIILLQKKKRFHFLKYMY